MSEDKKENKSFKLEDQCVRLLNTEPFFAALSLRLDKRECRSIPTAGVTINKSTQNFELLYNPEFFEKLSEVQRTCVLKHEYYHLIFEHVTSRRPGDTENNPVLAKTWNYATDLAINSHLKGELPEGCCIPEQKPFEKYPLGKNAEWYYNRLKQDENLQQQIAEGMATVISIDDHEGWSSGQQGKDGEGDTEAEAAKDMAKEKLKDMLRKAVNETAQGSNWGTISEATRKDILDRITPSVDWRNVLRYFIKTSQKANKSNSIKKINKRYPYIHSGKKTNRQAEIAISVDQSGSVGDELLIAFFSELDKLAEIATFTVIPFDHAVAEDKVFVWKKGQRKQAERVLCGGTDFDAPTKYVNERNFDGHIILTDLCAPKPIPSKCQRMWMTDEQNASHPYFQTNELVIAIKPAKGKENA